MLRPNLKLGCDLHQSLWATGWPQGFLLAKDTSHAYVEFILPQVNHTCNNGKVTTLPHYSQKTSRAHPCNTTSSLVVLRI